MSVCDVLWGDLILSCLNRVENKQTTLFKKGGKILILEFKPELLFKLYSWKCKTDQKYTTVMSDSWNLSVNQIMVEVWFKIEVFSMTPSKYSWEESFLEEILLKWTCLPLYFSNYRHDDHESWRRCSRIRMWVFCVCHLLCVIPDSLRIEGQSWGNGRWIEGRLRLLLNVMHNFTPVSEGYTSAAFEFATDSLPWLVKKGENVSDGNYIPGVQSSCVLGDPSFFVWHHVFCQSNFLHRVLSVLSRSSWQRMVHQ